MAVRGSRRRWCCRPRARGNCGRWPNACSPRCARATGRMRTWPISPTRCRWVAKPSSIGSPWWRRPWTTPSSASMPGWPAVAPKRPCSRATRAPATARSHCSRATIPSRPRFASGSRNASCRICSNYGLPGSRSTGRRFTRRARGARSACRSTRSQASGIGCRSANTRARSIRIREAAVVGVPRGAMQPDRPDTKRMPAHPLMRMPWPARAPTRPCRCSTTRRPGWRRRSPLPRQAARRPTGCAGCSISPRGSTATTC